MIFLDPDHDSTHDCSLCFVAHLITNSDVIEGSRKACGEVIGLSSEEKHQAGGIIPEEFIQAAHKECAANVSCCEKMKRFGFFICDGWEDGKCERTLTQLFMLTSSLMGMKRIPLESRNKKHGQCLLIYCCAVLQG